MRYVCPHLHNTWSVWCISLYEFRDVEILQSRQLDFRNVKCTSPTPLSLQIYRKLLFPIVGLEMHSS
jgi:hypothetical protein